MEFTCPLVLGSTCSSWVAMLSRSRNLRERHPATLLGVLSIPELWKWTHESSQTREPERRTLALLAAFLLSLHHGQVRASSPIRGAENDVRFPLLARRCACELDRGAESMSLLSQGLPPAILTSLETKLRFALAF